MADIICVIGETRRSGIRARPKAWHSLAGKSVCFPVPPVTDYQMMSAMLPQLSLPGRK